MMANFSNKIRDGGLVILDHKHMPTDEYGPSWYNHPGGVFQLNDSTSMSEECVIEWIGLNANNEMQTYSATVFKVHHHEKGNLGNVNWFDAIQPWLWNTVLEMALMTSQVQKMLDEEWSTFVLLEKIHAADQFVAVNENYKTSLTRELKRVIVHLGLTFHRILETTDIKIEIGTGGRSKQSIQPLHPGMPMETDLDFGTVSSGNQTIAYDYKDVNLNVKVEYIILERNYSGDTIHIVLH